MTKVPSTSFHFGLRCPKTYKTWTFRPDLPKDVRFLGADLAISSYTEVWSHVEAMSWATRWVVFFLGGLAFCFPGATQMGGAASPGGALNWRSWNTMGFFCITSWYTSWYHWYIHDFPWFFHHFSMISPSFSKVFHDFPSFSHHFSMISPSFSMIFPWFSYLFGISRPTSSEQPGTTGSPPPWRLPRAALFVMASTVHRSFINRRSFTLNYMVIISHDPIFEDTPIWSILIYEILWTPYLYGYNESHDLYDLYGLYGIYIYIYEHTIDMVYNII